MVTIYSGGCCECVSGPLCGAELSRDEVLLMSSKDSRLFQMLYISIMSGVPQRNGSPSPAPPFLRRGHERSERQREHTPARLRCK